MKLLAALQMICSNAAAWSIDQTAWRGPEFDLMEISELGEAPPAIPNGSLLFRSELGRNPPTCAAAFETIGTRFTGATIAIGRGLPDRWYWMPYWAALDPNVLLANLR